MVIFVASFLITIKNVKLVLGIYGKDKDEVPNCLAYAIIVQLCFLYVLTELLSIWSLLNYVSLMIGWGAYLLLNVGISCYFVKKGIFRIEISNIRYLLSKERIYLWIFLFFFVGMLFLSYYTVPYNWDSMAYHLPRITEWAQNGSIRHFAAGYPLQVSAPVFTEYIMLHVFVLCHKSDYLLTSVQCIAYLLDGVFVYLIAKKVGCNKSWSCLSAVIFYATPIAFSEALNTQNDLVTTAILLSFVLALLRFIKDVDLIDGSPAFNIHIFLLGAALGLSFLSKYYTAFVILIFLMWLLIVCIKNKVKFGVIAKAVLIAFIPVALIWLPEAVRLIETFGSLFAEEVSSGQMVGTLDPRLLALCFVKNLAFNFSGHYIYQSKELTEKAVALFAKILNVNLIDERISKYDYYTLNGPFYYNHDGAVATMICILFCISVCIMIVLLFRRKRREIDGYTLATCLTFAVFMTIMKFTTHRTRYEICYFALLCPAVCILFQNVLSDLYQTIAKSVVTAFCILEICSLVIYHAGIIRAQFIWSSSGDKYKGYFTYQESTYPSYQHIMNIIYKNDYHTLGMMTKGYFEYPIWTMAKGQINKIKCVNVENRTVVHEDDTFFPDCVLYIGNDNIDGDIIGCHGINYCVIDKYTDGYAWYVLAEKTK